MESIDVRALDRCEELAHPSLANFGISIFILVGILVSYLPQHYRIIARRSSQGLSPYFVLLGATSGTCAIANILVLPTSRVDLGCCRVNGAFSCAAGLLGIAQVGVQWSCFFFITFLFLIFIPRPSFAARGVNPADRPLEKAWREAIAIVAVCVVHFVITFIVSVVILARFPQHLQGWANFLGILCAILASIQYIPQIWTTWRLQEVASLSIPMMVIQTPGSFVFAGSLAFRLGTKGWSAWTVYIVTGSLQGCLLVMGIYFELRDRAVRKNRIHVTVTGDDDEGSVNVEGQGETERSPLLHNGNRQLLSAPRRGTHRPSNPLAPERLAPDPSSSSSESENSLMTRRKSWAGFKGGKKQPAKWFLARSRKSDLP